MHHLCRDAEQTDSNIRLLCRLQRSALRRTVVWLHLSVEPEALQGAFMNQDNHWAGLGSSF